MNCFAIAVLLEAADDAEKEPIQRTFAHRLALSWLVHSGVAEQWQAEKFWDLLGRGEYPEWQRAYCRQRDFTIYTGAWKRAAGLDYNWRPAVRAKEME